MCGRIIKKYRCLTKTKKFSNVITKRIVAVEDPIRHERRMKINATFVSGQIKKFYDQNSTIDPCKKNYKKVGTEKIQKQYLNASLTDLYEELCAENSFKVSYTTFTRYFPVYCAAQKITERNTCACVPHVNFSFLIDTLHRKKILKENSKNYKKLGL